jgi:hypothetical protein
MFLLVRGVLKSVSGCFEKLNFGVPTIPWHNRKYPLPRREMPFLQLNRK